MRIGFFDSGIGGLTVLHQALRFLPHEDYLFYADTLHVPYGEKTKDEVRAYILDAADFIAGQKVKALVIACNTATSIVIEELRTRYDFPVIGIEPAVKPAIERWAGKQKKVLVLATNLTLKEKKYNDLIQRIDQGESVDSLALPGLVQFAENFEFDEEKVVPYLEKELSRFDLKQYGTVVLGCTHFPYFENSLRRVFPKEVDFISGSIGTAKHLRRILELKNQMDQGTGDIIFFKSGVKVEDPLLLANYHSLFEVLDKLS
ncbi:glutamate racemase 2 [Paenibacillus antibioticophila]|uniref:Glutamate racemase n=1 Tax=Paenibacillus antibioticophila TaxID=1274374 RepID=A0A919XPS5_9BACL|nr:glutamate racemase [Paenibacillus antibioticophila]GIO35333.1 glutamate racemase 2 [Paenibacillus antibioticophila]